MSRNCRHHSESVQLSRRDLMSVRATAVAAWPPTGTRSDVRSATGDPHSAAAVGDICVNTSPEVGMLLAVAAILLILAVVGGVVVHPLLFLIALLAIVVLFAGRRGTIF